MCLAIPAKIEKMSAQRATVALGASRTEISLALVPEAGVGDWVLVHAGFAIALLDEADARQTWEYLQEAGLGEMPAELLASDGRDDGGPSGQAGDGGAETGAHRG